MAELKITSLASYDLTLEEELEGSSFTITQKQFIQNQIALVSEAKLALIPESNNYPAFIQAEAHMSGEIAAYKYLLDCSEASEAARLNPPASPAI